MKKISNAYLMRRFTVKVFHNDTKNYHYTYERKATNSRVKWWIKKAMLGFNNVSVEHVKDIVYHVYSTGPDENTSNEMRNLAQMGEFSPYVVKRKNFMWDKVAKRF